MDKKSKVRPVTFRGSRLMTRTLRNTYIVRPERRISNVRFHLFILFSFTYLKIDYTTPKISSLFNKANQECCWETTSVIIKGVKLLLL